MVLHGALGEPPPLVDAVRPARAISYFEGGPEMGARADLLARDVQAFLREIGTDNRRVAVEYVNPSATQALVRAGLEVVDAADLVEEARIIKSADEIACMKWAIAVADLGIGKLKEATRPGVTEVQLWALLSYTNLANNGDWHDGRMLASGDRINPWLREASERRSSRPATSSGSTPTWSARSGTAPTSPGRSSAAPAARPGARGSSTGTPSTRSSTT